MRMFLLASSQAPFGADNTHVATFAINSDFKGELNGITFPKFYAENESEFARCIYVIPALHNLANVGKVLPLALYEVLGVHKEQNPCATEIVRSLNFTLQTEWLCDLDAAGKPKAAW